MGKKGIHPVEVTDHTKSSRKIHVSHPDQCTVDAIPDDQGHYLVVCIGSKHPSMRVTRSDRKLLIEAGATEFKPPKPEGTESVSAGSKQPGVVRSSKGGGQ